MMISRQTPPQQMPVNPAHPGIPGLDDQTVPAGAVDFIDVSHFQGKVDWDKYEASGRKLALCKITESSSWSDPTAADNRAGMARAGVECGVYHFAGSGPRHTIGKAKQEADFYLSKVGKLAPTEFPALDFEQPDGLTPAQQVKWIGSWCKEVEAKTGKTPWLYTGEKMITLMGDKAKDLTKYPLWLADYNSSDRTEPPSSGAWPELTAWQFTHKAQIDGVSVPVDGSYLYGQAPKAQAD